MSNLFFLVSVQDKKFIKTFVTIVFFSQIFVQLFAQEKIEKTSKDDVIVLEDIVVTGTSTSKRLSETPVATEVISRKEIENSGANNVADILKDHAGASMRYSTMGGYSLSLQGLDSKYVLILVDGQRVNGRIRGVIDLSRFSAEEIDHIEIVKGAHSALYGSDAIGGVVNIITRKSKRPLDIEIVSALGAYNPDVCKDSKNGCANIIALNGRLGFNLGLLSNNTTFSYKNNDSYDLDEATITMTGRAYSEFNVANNSKIQVSKKFKVLFSADVNHRQEKGISSSDGYFIFDETKNTTTTSALFSPQYDINSNSAIKVSGHFSFFDDSFNQISRNSSLLNRQDETKEKMFDVKAQYDLLLLKVHLLSLGVSGIFENIETERIEDKKKERLKQGIFIQDEWSLFKKPLLILVPGIRFDNDSEFGSNVSPKLALRFDPIKKITLRSSYSLGFRAPSFKELYLQFKNPSAGYYISGNPNLKAESSRSVQLGAEFRPIKWFWFSLDFHRTDIKDMISYESAGKLYGLTWYKNANISEAYAQGVETMFGFQLLKMIALKFGYTFTDTKDKKLNRPLEGSAKHQGTFMLSFTKKSWGTNVSIKGSLSDKRPYYFDEIKYAKAHLMMGFYISQKFGNYFTTFIGADNLMNAGDLDFMPIPPRRVYFGAKFRFYK